MNNLQLSRFFIYWLYACTNVCEKNCYARNKLVDELKAQNFSEDLNGSIVSGELKMNNDKIFPMICIEDNEVIK